MSQCQQNSVMCSVCNCSRVFAFYLENKAFAQELSFLKNVLKLSILPIESFYHRMRCRAISKNCQDI